MIVPNIPTTDGGFVPVTTAPDSLLIDLYFQAMSEKDDKQSRKERSLVGLLCFPATDTYEEATSILRMCLEKGRSLVAVYPSLGETPPKNATPIGEIDDGWLYLI